MDKAQAAREARALTAEWMWQMRQTECDDDAGWRAVYTPEDLARVDAALDQLWDRLNDAGPSLFFRRARKVGQR